MDWSLDNFLSGLGADSGNYSLSDEFSEVEVVFVFPVGLGISDVLLDFLKVEGDVDGHSLEEFLGVEEDVSPGGELLDVGGDGFAVLQVSGDLEEDVSDFDHAVDD